jgi:hypothetical protein
MLETIKKNKIAQVTLLAFLFLTGWWVYLQITKTGAENNWFGISYGAVALIGAVVGLRVSSRWGGLKSYIGRALAMFALGLFAQEFGQIAYWFYVFILKSDVPYPSIGDIGFFGSIPLYIYGVILLARASGAKFSLRSLSSKLQAFLIPLLLLIVSYRFFLQGYEFDWSHPLTVLLDFGYPFGQAIYISIAILAFLFSRKLLGGLMRSRILWVLFALFAQYISDFTFLYQSHNGTWQAGGINDYMYLISYLIMTLAIMSFGQLFIKLQSQSGSAAKPDGA